MKYFDWIEPLADIYLEDSFVLEIRQRPTEVEFEMDFVLQESHPNYSLPHSGEQYCYRRGILRLSNCTNITVNRISNVNFDADGETDLGNIDTFDRDGDRIAMSGDWGDLSLTSNEAMVFLAQ